MIPSDHELDVISHLARAAGRAILEVYGSDFDVRYKGRNDPVTDADLKAQEIIVSGLSRAFPNDGIVSEESPVSDDVRARSRVWYVDPMDGTGEFVARTGEFVVMIGLVEKGRPTCGVIYRPTEDVLYAGSHADGSWVVVDGARRRVTVSQAGPPARLRLAVSRSHRHPIIDSVKASLGNLEEIHCGSVGAKIGLLVEGLVDAYVEPSTYTSKWDVCAPDAILRGAGGCLTDLGGKPVEYTEPDLKNRKGFIATNQRYHEAVLRAIPKSYVEKLLDVPNPG